MTLPFLSRSRLRPRAGTPPVPQSPTDIALSAASIADNATGGTDVGTLSATDSDSSSFTWTIVSQPAGNPFALSGANPAATIILERSGTGTLTAGSKTVRIRADDGSSTPYEEDMTVTVTDSGSDLALMTLTLTENGTGAKTSEPFAIVIPLTADQLPSGRTLRAYDDNGSGAKGTVLANFQVALPSTDLAGATRMVVLSGIVPALASGGTRKLFLETTTTAATTGTAITASDVLATSFQAVVNFDIGGTTYAFDARAALAAGSSFSKTDYQLVAIESGPTRTRWLASGPPKNAGTAHASGDGLRVAMEIVAYKAGTAAVGGGNAITLVEFKAECMNEDLVRGTAVNYFYGWNIQRATSLSDGTLITSDQNDVDGNVNRLSYAREASPTGTLTATGGTSTGAQTWTRSTGTFATDCVGAHIRCGGGGAIIKTRNSATSVNVYIYQAASGTSFSSGNWSIEGIGHEAGMRFYRCGAVGTLKSAVLQWGDNSNAITPTTRAAMDVLAASKCFINNDLPFASVTHSTTQLDTMRASDGSIRPLSFRGSAGTVLMGEITTDIGGPGDRVDIGPVPAWCTNGLVKCTAAGRRRIFENAHHFATWNFLAPVRLSGSPTNGQLGVWPRADNGTNYNYNPAQGGTQIARPAAPFVAWTYDVSHMPLPFYFPYLLTGDLFWLRCMQRQEVAGVQTVYNEGYNGAGANGTVYGEATGNASFYAYYLGEGQTRGKAWGLSSLLQAALCTPDSLSNLVVNDKTYYAARLAKTWNALKVWGPTDPGSRRSGATKTPQWLKQNTDTTVHPTYSSGSTIESLWQICMNLMMQGLAKEMGLTDSDGDAGYSWSLGALTDIWDDANANMPMDYMFGSFWLVLRDSTNYADADPTSWGAVYKRSAHIAPIDQTGSIQGPRRTGAGTATLSANTVGSGRTFTFSNSYFAAGSWYVGAYIYDLGNGGIFKITSVNSGTQVTGDLLVAFTSATPTASNLRLPGIAPADYAGSYATIPTADYAQKIVSAARIAADHNIQKTKMEAIIAYMVARSGYAEAGDNMRVARRT